MGAKLDYVLQIFEKNNFRHLKNSLPFVKEDTLIKSDLFDQLKEVYVSLGGVEPIFPFKRPEWDLEFEDFAVILDEEISFNRYRAITLRSPLYEKSTLLNVENYNRYCRQFETECLKAGRSINNWTDKESEKYFGRSEAPGDLALAGAAKWKQRAFFDFLTDAIAHVGKIRLIRLSIYDNIMINNQIIKVNNLLSSRNLQNEKYLWSYLQRKIKN